MSFWLREIAGWLLVGLGLLIFALVYGACTARPNPLYIEAGILLVMGIFVFRGGIGLLRVALAANVVRRSQQEQAKAAGRASVSDRSGLASRVL
jgi:hypothetical protein